MVTTTVDNTLGNTNINLRHSTLQYEYSKPYGWISKRVYSIWSITLYWACKQDILHSMELLDAHQFEECFMEVKREIER